MSRVVFMCGPAGSGKSTVARTLEEQGMIRLSFDQKAWERGLKTMPLPADTHAEIKAELQDELIRLVRSGQDVVLDFSFWSRAMREEWRELLATMGVVPETLYLATDRETCLSRLGRRDMVHGDDFQLAPDVAASYFNNFEAPDPDEGPLTVVSG